MELYDIFLAMLRVGDTTYGLYVFAILFVTAAFMLVHRLINR